MSENEQKIPGLVVQKYGGSSVATPEKIKNVAAIIKKRLYSEQSDAPKKLAVVVSAMGKTTDGLLALAREVSTNPDAREMDMLLATGEQVSAALLAMALQEVGVTAISHNAFQLGIITSSSYSNARIQGIDLSRLQHDFETHQVVVITGFQGITEEGDITTLGRGGSDTSAVAIAAKAGATCEIYSDVPGIFTCDPNKVPGARKLDYITYDEMMELASLGAKVLHARAVELARKYGVTLYCGSTFSEERGTNVVKNLPEWLECPVVTGVTAALNQEKFVVKRVPGNGDVLAGIFHVLTQERVNVDMISTATDGDRTFLTFTALNADVQKIERCLRDFMESLGQNGWEIETPVPVAKISAVGDGMNAATGVAERFFAAIRKRKIAIMGITTSEINISVLVDVAHADDAVRALAEEFNLVD